MSSWEAITEGTTVPEWGRKWDNVQADGTAMRLLVEALGATARSTPVLAGYCLCIRS